MTDEQAAGRSGPGESPAWSHFPHDADVGLRARGRDLAAAFAGAATALTAAITDPAAVRPLERVVVECQAPNAELLLYDWLNALVFEMATRGMLFSRFDVETDGSRLRAVAHGERLDRRRHQPAVEVKGATYTALSVRRDGDDWIAECVVDV